MPPGLYFDRDDTHRRSGEFDDYIYIDKTIDPKAYHSSLTPAWLKRTFARINGTRMESEIKMTTVKGITPIYCRKRIETSDTKETHLFALKKKNREEWDLFRSVRLTQVWEEFTGTPGSLSIFDKYYNAERSEMTISKIRENISKEAVLKAFNTLNQDAAVKTSEVARHRQETAEKSAKHDAWKKNNF